MNVSAMSVPVPMPPARNSLSYLSSLDEYLSLSSPRLVSVGLCTMSSLLRDLLVIILVAQLPLERVQSVGPATLAALRPLRALPRAEHAPHVPVRSRSSHLPLSLLT